MSVPLRLLPEAQDELDDAVVWYERRRPGQGLALLARVRDVLQRIAATPNRYGIVYQDVRKVTVRGFPYIVLYRVEAGEVIVIAVFHTSRDPSVWQSRV